MLGNENLIMSLILNVAKKVPALKEGDFTLGESHAIMKYLHSTRELPDHWYPKDAKQRAKIDEYLDWHHTSTLLLFDYESMNAIL